jgi:hypothetical protein
VAPLAFRRKFGRIGQVAPAPLAFLAAGRDWPVRIPTGSARHRTPKKRFGQADNP